MTNITPGQRFLRQIRSIGLSLALLAPLSGCYSVFTSVDPTSGATCDAIEVHRDPDHRSNCGINTVNFDGVPASDICLEGTGGACGVGTALVFTIPETWPARSGTLNVEQSIAGTGCGLLGGRASGVYTFPFTVTERLRRPGVTLTADDEEIEAGGGTVLRWTVTGTTTRIRLDSLTVGATGFQTVTPALTRTYRLTAENSCLSSTDAVTVCVYTRQLAPRITGIDSTRPGLAFRVDGSNLGFTRCTGALESSLIFTQDGRTLPPVVDASPSASRLDGTLPAALMPGDARVVARVGTMESASFAFTVGGRLNGRFRRAVLHQSGTHTCGTSGSTLAITGTGGRRTATFGRGGTDLGSVSFDLGSEAGAGFSPSCRYGVVVGKNNHLSDSVNTYYSMSTHELIPSLHEVAGETSMGPYIKLLFSPDDTVIVAKSRDNFLSHPRTGSIPAEEYAAILLYDALRSRPLPGPGTGIACSLPGSTPPCDDVIATMTNFNDVNVTVDSTSVGSFPVE